MELNDFFILTSNLSSKTIQVHPIGLRENEDNNGLFEAQRLILGDFSNIKFPILFKHEYGDTLEDVLDTGWPSLYLISEKMLNVLIENNLTGWKTFSVKIQDKQGEELKGYHGLAIVGKCGLINYSKSNIIEKPIIPDGPHGKFQKGIYIDLETWDGSDFFIPEKYFGIIVSKKVVSILNNNKISNLKFEGLLDIETFIDVA